MKIGSVGKHIEKENESNGINCTQQEMTTTQQRGDALRQLVIPHFSHSLSIFPIEHQ